MLQNFTLPDLGEGIHEGEILEVAISPGDDVKEGDVILVVETDKAAVEIPSPYTGIVEEVRVKTHDVVKVGSVMVVFQVKEKEGGPVKHTESTTPLYPEKTAPDTRTSQGKKGPVPASPATRKLARELAVDLGEIAGSGPAGLVTADDVRSFAQGKSTESRVQESVNEGKENKIAFPSASVQLPDFSRWGDVETIPLQSIRRAIARKMSLSWSQIPHVSHQELADVTELEKIRQKNKVEVEEHGGKLTLTIFALKAIFAALEAFPRFNSSLDTARKEIILKKYYNLGIATDTERGLLVPVIRDVGKKSMLELAIELPQVTEKARQGRLTIDESTGGTFTITNIGGIGGTGFTPIINFPQVAILGLGKARWQPVVCENNRGEQDIVPRLMLPLVLSFDHRVLDGAEGAHFANHVKETLENPARILFFEH
jgi:pyruvate dehydrogenase E2 component (dihydrolipoamide acetyltransferase)